MKDEIRNRKTSKHNVKRITNNAQRKPFCVIRCALFLVPCTLSIIHCSPHPRPGIGLTKQGNAHVSADGEGLRILHPDQGLVFPAISGVINATAAPLPILESKVAQHGYAQQGTVVLGGVLVLEICFGLACFVERILEPDDLAMVTASLLEDLDMALAGTILPDAYDGICRVKGGKGKQEEGKYRGEDPFHTRNV